MFQCIKQPLYYDGESFPYYAKNGQKSQCFTIYNEYKQWQTKYSFFSFSNEANNKIDQPMLENSQASDSRVFIGVLSKFPKLKTSVFRIAGQPFIRWIRVIRTLCLNCNPIISIISHIVWTPTNKARKTTLNILFTSLYKLKSPNISSYIVRLEKFFICRIKWILWCFGS